MELVLDSASTLSFRVRVITIYEIENSNFKMDLSF
jgi:hypothetical protein